ncbi:MAG: PEP-CTERM sorting domain-containing protein [Phycisphaerales bacterium]|nr:PEP-CTERM sorting domain-containing protein [Phycisphaerales bacterium]
MKKSLFVAALAGAAMAASAQNSVTFVLTATNLTDNLRGTNALPGDVFRIEISAIHTGMSLGLAKFDLAFDGSSPAQGNFTESGAPVFNLGADMGRHPFMRNAVSDRPVGSPTGASAMTAFVSDADTWTLSDAAASGIDLATFPPTANLLVGIDPISSGEAFYAFGYTYDGGTDTISMVIRGASRLFRSATDGSGATVSSPIVENDIVITPAPASLALLGLGGFAAARRRRA